MLVLVSYDVSTSDAAGRTRLRRAADACRAMGTRVQNSVFECHIDYAQYVRLKEKLSGIIDPKADSLRFYLLGNQWRGRVEHVGIKPSYDPEDLLLI